MKQPLPNDEQRRPLAALKAKHRTGAPGFTLVEIILVFF